MKSWASFFPCDTVLSQVVVLQFSLELRLTPFLGFFFSLFDFANRLGQRKPAGLPVLREAPLIAKKEKKGGAFDFANRLGQSKGWGIRRSCGKIALPRS